MKYLIPLILLLLASCNSAPLFSSGKQVSMEYTGFVSIDEEFVQFGKSVILFLSFEGGKWNENSAICFSKCRAKISKKNIYLRVYTETCSGDSPQKHSVDFVTDYGTYDVYFVDPDGTTHYLQKITI